MSIITTKELYAWCKIPYDKLEGHPTGKIPFRLCQDSTEMGQLMARELVDEIRAHNTRGEVTRAIIPCGPSCWYKPFTDLVNAERVSLKNFVVFHMDECLDWQGQELPRRHPYNFRGFMEGHFYDPIDDELAVPEQNRHWLTADNILEIKEKIWSEPIDLTYGGWGQDGHIAYNQARRHPYSQVTIDDARNSTVRVQYNNIDTILALAQRTFGTAYQFVPPMSVTLGVKECLSAKKVRLFSDTGAWKQTALRVALFGPLTPEYPITLLQEHPDALLTATIDTARHPIGEHPEWELGV
ncbi:MAG: sugar phosphate isomerase family [Planctomycetota bacterium]|jgi:glucosamine-6-phosphate deaminase